MDNLTHTLIGISAAESFSSSQRNRASYWALVLGNNVPDIDIVQTLLPNQNSLDYLVHHRGYTHTFLAAPFLALAVASLASGISGSKGRFGKRLYGISLLGCLMHTGADFLNNYGVHPFSPFWNRWFYGDTLFIIEPLLWVAILPAAFWLASRRGSRWFWGILSAAVFALVWLNPFMTAPFRALITFVGFASAWLHQRRPDARPSLIFAGMLLILFSSLSWMAHRQVEARLLSEGIKATQILDVDATSLPGNPLCWGSWARILNGGEIHSRWSQIAILPSILNAEECEHIVPRGLSVPVTRLNQPEQYNDQHRWIFEVRTPIAQIEFLKDHSCDFRRALTFYRFPHVLELGQSEWLILDLRYNRSDRRSFASFRVQASSERVVCPSGNEPWEFPSERHRLSNE